MSLTFENWPRRLQPGRPSTPPHGMLPPTWTLVSKMDLDIPHAWFVTKAFTVEEFAELFGISVSQVLAHVGDGTLRAVDVGRGPQRRDLRITDEAVEDFVRKKTVSPGRASKPAITPLMKRKVKAGPGVAEGYIARRAARATKENP